MGDTNLIKINRDVNKLENLGVPFLKVANKIDKANSLLVNELKDNHPDTFFISSGNKENLEELKVRIM